MHPPTPEEIAAERASALMGVVEDLTWTLGAGWAVAAGLWYESWVVGIAVYVAILFFVRRPYYKADKKAWDKLSSLNRQPDTSQPSDQS